MHTDLLDLNHQPLLYAVNGSETPPNKISDLVVSCQISFYFVLSLCVTPLLERFARGFHILEGPN